MPFEKGKPQPQRSHVAPPADDKNTPIAPPQPPAPTPPEPLTGIMDPPDEPLPDYADIEEARRKIAAHEARQAKAAEHYFVANPPAAFHLLNDEALVIAIAAANKSYLQQHSEKAAITNGITAAKIWAKENKRSHRVEDNS